MVDALIGGMGMSEGSDDERCAFVFEFPDKGTDDSSGEPITPRSYDAQPGEGGDALEDVRWECPHSREGNSEYCAL